MRLQRGMARRMRFSAVISATMLPGAAKSRTRISYFSEFEIFLAARQRRRFAKLEAGIHPPQAGQGAASAARIRNPARPEVCRKSGLISGVLTKKCGRKKSRTGGAFSSVRYSVSSCLVLRQVK